MIYSDHNFSILSKTNSGSIELVHCSSIKDDEAILPSLEFLKVVNNSLGSKIFVLENTLSVVVTQENDLSSIDGNNMMLFENDVEDEFTFFVLDFSNVSWVLPDVVNHDWVTWRHFKTIAQSAKINFPTLTQHLDQASNC